VSVPWRNETKRGENRHTDLENSNSRKLEEESKEWNLKERVNWNLSKLSMGYKTLKYIQPAI